jgi:hypothetical protein
VLHLVNLVSASAALPASPSLEESISRTSSPAELEEKVNNHLHLASQHLACPNPAVESGRKDSQLIVLSDVYDILPETVSRIVEEASSPDFGFAIRIDTSEDINLNLDAAITFHNYAMACRCHSRTHNISCIAATLLLISFQLSQSAYRLLSQQSILETTETEVVSRILLISVVVMQNMIHLCYQLGYVHDGHKYHQSLKALHETLRKLHRWPFERAGNMIAAAA